MARQHTPFMILLVIVSLVSTTAAFYVVQTQPCSTGEECQYTSSRSYVNNYVFCCPPGSGNSVSVWNNVVHCQCGGGTYINNVSSTIFRNGQQLNATEAKPYIDAMNRAHQENMEQFHRNMAQFNANMQQFQQNLQMNMAALQARLSNMAQNFAQNFGQTMARAFPFW